MALRGETIGRAYIKILADGSGLDRSIRDEMHDAEPAIEVGGREHEKAYSKAYNDALTKDKNFEKSYRKKIDQAFGAMSARAQTLSGTLQRRIADAVSEGFDFGMEVPVSLGEDPDLDRRARLIGEKAGHNIAVGLNEGMDPKDIDFGREVRRAIKGVADDMENEWRSSLRNIGQQNAVTTRDIRRNFAGAAHSIREAQGAIREFDREFASGSRVAANFWKAVGQDSDVSVRKLDRFRSSITKVGDSIGRGFGKGARNNFFNLFGTIIGGAIKLPASIIGAVSKVGDMLGNFILDPMKRINTAFKDGVTTGEKWGNAIAQLAAEAAASGPALIAVAAGVLLIGGAIGGVVGAVSALAGALTGLVATVGFGLVGVLGGAAAALLPLAAAIGGVALAIHGVGGFKAIAQDLKPLKKSVDDLSKSVASEAFANMGSNVEKANSALRKMDPLAHAVGEGLRGMIDGFVDGLDSPAFNKFRNQMVIFLPGAMTKLGHTISNIFGGLGGVFRALTTDVAGSRSIATKFLDTVERLTGRFSAWANSAKGQNTIRNFFDRAWESAQKLGHFIRVGIGLIGNLLGKAKPTGDTLFDDMTKKMQEWSDWLSNPAHQDQIRKWFGDALSTAREVGHAIKRVGDLIAAIDTPKNRKIGKVMFQAMSAEIGIAISVVNALGFAVKFVFNQFRLLLKVMRPILDVIAHIPGNPFQEMAKGAVKAIDKFEKFADKADDARKRAEKISHTKIDMNTAPALKKLGLVIKYTKDGKTQVTRLDGSKVDVNTRKAAIAIQNVSDKAKVAKQKVDAADGNKIQVNTQPAVNSLFHVESSAKNAHGAVNNLDGTSVGVSTGSAVASINNIAQAAVNAANQVARIALGGGGHGKAAGGVIWGPQRLLVGEEGPEAIVPLSRPLGRVDPAVRQLSAIAQGIDRAASGGVVGGAPGKVVNVGGMTIVTPTRDPSAVASEVVNRLVAVGY